uniref:Uncharacterized protein n=1 Tax=Acrobeloides nanus TaxID=290746 RepID=A0A914DRB3_9BILA
METITVDELMRSPRDYWSIDSQEDRINQKDLPDVTAPSQSRTYLSHSYDPFHIPDMTFLPPEDARRPPSISHVAQSSLLSPLKLKSCPKVTNPRILALSQKSKPSTSKNQIKIASRGRPSIKWLIEHGRLDQNDDDPVLQKKRELQNRHRQKESNKLTGLYNFVKDIKALIRHKNAPTTLEDIHMLLKKNGLNPCDFE